MMIPVCIRTTMYSTCINMYTPHVSYYVHVLILYMTAWKMVVPGRGARVDCASNLQCILHTFILCGLVVYSWLLYSLVSNSAVL